MIDFPNAPTDGQVFNAGNGVMYQWQATPGAWVTYSASGGAGGDFTCSAYTTGFGSTIATVVFGAGQVISGNTGGWYNPANGRWTPPAGRYHVFAQVSAALSTGATLITLQLRKNGTAIYGSSQTPSTANWYGDPQVALNLDANGTDWFDIQASCNNGSNLNAWCSFGAFPIGRVLPVLPVSGDFYVTAPAAIGLATSATVLVPTTVVSGNSGSWYNTTTGRFTPPAGRYCLYTWAFFGQGAGNATQVLGLYKNGVLVPNTQTAVYQATASASQSGSLTTTVDANGTDYFDVRGSANAGGSQVSAMGFGAFPISGAIGPPGPPGPPGSATTAAFNVRNTANGFALTGPNFTSVFRSPGAPVKDYDPGNVITVANACQFIAPTDGRYHLELSVYLAQTVANQCAVVIQHTNVAGTVVRSYGDLHTADNNAYATQYHVAADIQMLAGEKIDWLFSASSGTVTPISNGTLGGLAASAITYAFGHRIGT